MAYAFALVGLRWLARDDAESGGTGGAAIATVAMGNLLACVAALPMALPASGISTKDVAVLLYLGAFQIGLAYFCLTRGIRHVPAVEATALLMVEPALNPVWTWLVNGEKPGTWAVAGGALILSATLWNTWRAARARAG
jgi:drug/metabolite transporter (DMT)-like permease